ARLGRVPAAFGGRSCGAGADDSAREDGVKISGSYTLPLPPERTYQMMQDPEVLARAIPGCEGLEKTGEGEYRMKMQMALASLSGAFEGRVRITDQTPSLSFRLVVEGAGRIGLDRKSTRLNSSHQII